MMRINGFSGMNMQAGTMGLSQASMQAMLSADSSMKQADIQGSMATQMEGRAGVLASEIKQDAGRGDTAKKEEELADLQAKAQSATAAQMSTLADANQSIEEAAKADDSAETAEKNKDKNTKTDRTDQADKTDQTEQTDKTEKTSETASATADHAAVKAEPEGVYTPIDIRL